MLITEGGVVNPGLSLDEGPDVVTVDTNSKPKMAKRENSAYLRRQQAVSVRRAFKAYGSSKAPNHILQNLNMTVEKGTIYGLLGASGCGKTTLLSCIVGRRRLDNGEIFVLGGKPGHKGSGVPGKRVGYMPQEIALYGEFSIKETMMYFGWIFGMESSDIMDRLTFLLNFLDLPSQSRLVKNLSGGQQRRVSFAVALMHDPELLILDEPTVGVDPLLRQSIWNHLVQISKDGNKTVIITTHYIEEARQAHTIGLMRSGKLLAEEAPATLLTMYNCSSLEEVFLKLSRIQGQQNSTNDELLAKNMNLATLHWGKNQEPVYVTEESGVVGLNFHQKKEPEPTSNGYYIQEDQDEKNQGGCNKCLDLFKLTTKGKTKALLQKNFLRMWRNVGVMLFIFALPVMQVILFCLAIGRDPTGLHLAIVNDEVTRNNLTMETCPVYSNCTIKFLSCRYISSLRTDTIIKDYYPDLDSAIQAIKDGKVWGALHFNANYSKELMARVLLGTGADEDTLEQSDIRVWMDMSINHSWLLRLLSRLALDATISNTMSVSENVRMRSHPGKLVLIIDEYRRLEDALDAVKQGDAWGVIHFNENFTDALSARMVLGQTSDEETLEESQFSVWLDMSNQQIGLMLNRDLQFAYRTFAQNMLTSCGNNPKVADIPIQFQEPIYGSNDPSFTDFVAPGVILTIVFFLAVALTSSALIIERMEGLLDRSWVAGVMPHEVLFSHVITQFVVMCGQTALVLIFMISVFNVQCEGNIFLVVLLTILQGLCGMCFGFVISAVCELERNAIQLALGSFYPTLLLSGVIWPVEGMPIVLRYISYCLPLTLATTSLRAMMSRGWGFGEPDVYYGYMSTIIWIVAFLTVALMVLKMKKG